MKSRKLYLSFAKEWVIMLTGLVLCGGNSSRMGTDKGLLKKGSESWAEIAYYKLSKFTSETYISVNYSQINTYADLFDNDILIEDSVSVKGPLAALLSAFERYPESNFIVLACDMPDTHTSLIKTLLEEYAKTPLKDFYVFLDQGEHEPLLGIYTSRGLKKVYDLYMNENLEKNSMKYILDKFDTLSIVIPTQGALKNYNSTQDL